MDKPFFYLGSAYLWTLMLISLSGNYMAFALLALAGVLALLVGIFMRGKTGKAFRKQILFFSVACTVVLASGLFLLQTKVIYEPVLSLAGSNARLTGYVTEVLPDSSTGAHRCVVRVLGLAPETDDSTSPKVWRSVRTVRLSNRNYRPKTNDLLDLSVYLSELGASDPDVQDYYKSRGLYLGAATTERITATNLSECTAAEREELGVGPVRYARRLVVGTVQNFRDRLTGTLFEWLSEDNASVLSGMLVGDKTRVSGEDKTAFQRSGILHLFAVSGFHTSLWSMILYRAFLRAGAGRKSSCLAAIVFLLFFVTMTGFSRSAIRACIMLGIFFLSRMTVQSADSLNSLGFAVFCLLLPNPFYGGDTGILLSYFATLGILTAYPVLMKPVREEWLKEKVQSYHIRKRLEAPISLLAVSLSAFVFTLPCIALCFGSVSLVSPLSNLLVSAVSSAAILLSGAGALTSLLPGISLITPWCLLTSGLVVKYMRMVCVFLGNLPFSYVGVANRSFLVGLAGAILVAVAGFVLFGFLPKEEGRGPWVRVTALLCSVVLLSSVLTGDLWHRNEVRVSFGDVEGALVVVSYRREAVVIGCGGDSYSTPLELSDILDQAGVSSVSALIVPGTGEGEAGAMEEVLNLVSPKKVFLPKETTLPVDVTVESAPEPAYWGNAEEQVLQLFPEVTLTLYRQDGTYGAGLLTVQNVPLLLVFRPSVNVSLLPPESRSAVACYSRRKLPQQLKLDPSSYIIVSGESGSVAALVCGGKYKFETERKKPLEEH